MGVSPLSALYGEVEDFKAIVSSSENATSHRHTLETPFSDNHTHHHGDSSSLRYLLYQCVCVLSVCCLLCVCVVCVCCV
ncbi:hypothetical protein P4O66_016962 [Electrophorus voltai]|uniref:Uncharacterized protein n=1 Tax=Electrophorus voltai TaxID=2609070 RepID=A0AAD8YWG1_9TELE|nr:hypothetical protein P4O66_016962 [Electrophorus voltai]